MSRQPSLTVGVLLGVIVLGYDDCVMNSNGKAAREIETWEKPTR